MQFCGAAALFPDVFLGGRISIGTRTRTVQRGEDFPGPFFIIVSCETAAWPPCCPEDSFEHYSKCKMLGSHQAKMSTLKKKKALGALGYHGRLLSSRSHFNGGEMLGARGPYGVEFHDTSSTASLI